MLPGGVAHHRPRDPLPPLRREHLLSGRDSLAFSEPLIGPRSWARRWLGGRSPCWSTTSCCPRFALTAFATCVLVESWTGSLRPASCLARCSQFNTQHASLALPHPGHPSLRSAARAAGAGSRRALRLARAALALAMCWPYSPTPPATSSSSRLSLSAWRSLRVLPEWLPRARQVAARPRAGAVVAGPRDLRRFTCRTAARPSRAAHAAQPRRIRTTRRRRGIPVARRGGSTSDLERAILQIRRQLLSGFVILALAAFAIVLAWRRRPPPGDPLRARLVMLVAIGVTGVVLSLGTATPVYGWVFTIFPPMQGLRAAARFGNLFLLAVAILAHAWSLSGHFRSFLARGWLAMRGSFSSPWNRCGGRSSTALRSSALYPPARERTRGVVLPSSLLPALVDLSKLSLRPRARSLGRVNLYAAILPTFHSRRRVWTIFQRRGDPCHEDAASPRVVPSTGSTRSQTCLMRWNNRADFELMAIVRHDLRPPC